MKPAVLYLSYDGMLEPLGQSQVLAYLERLARDFRIILLSFEKAEDWVNEAEREALRARTAAAGIAWHPLRYHKRPSAPATAYDIAAGIAVGTWLARREGVRILHARSYVAAVMARQIKRLTGARLLFDMRGLWADERVDGGLWPRESRLYRAAKAAERQLLANADHVVTLTHASVGEIAALAARAGAQPPIDVIPTCADLDRFVPRQGPPPPRFTLGHVGSTGTWYLFDELLAFFRLLANDDGEARLLIVNRGEHPFIEARLAACGIDRRRVELTGGRPDEMPGFVQRMSAGSAIIKPVYSKLASAPTKLGEYLGSGVPCLGNAGVGDMAAILEGDRVGVALGGFAEAELRAGVNRLRALLADPDLAGRCVATARRLFSLETGAQAYRGIYRALLASA